MTFGAIEQFVGAVKQFFIVIRGATFMGWLRHHEHSFDRTATLTWRYYLFSCLFSLSSSLGGGDEGSEFFRVMCAGRARDESWALRRPDG